MIVVTSVLLALSQWIGRPRGGPAGH
jgi:hypothetical protein